MSLCDSGHRKLDGLFLVRLILVMPMIDGKLVTSLTRNVELMFIVDERSYILVFELIILYNFSDVSM